MTEFSDIPGPRRGFVPFRTLPVWSAFLLILWLGCRVSLVAAPSPTAPLGSGSWLERKWTVQEGLPGNIVPALLQSRTGRTWIGTLDGLAWSDGFKIYSIHSRDYPNAPDQGVWSLLEARDGTLWIGGHNGHIHAFRQGRFDNLTPSGIGSFNITLGESGDGTLWAGGPQGLWTWSGRQWERPKGAAGLFIVDIKALAPSAKGGLWVGTQDRGLWLLDRDGSLTSFPLVEGNPNLEISRILEDRKGRVWVGTHGFGLLLLENHRLRQVPNGRLDLIIESLSLGRDGNLWVGSNLGLFRSVDGVLHPFQEGTFGRYSRIPAVLEDREGTLWAGTWQEGLVHLRKANLDLIGGKEGIAGGVYSLSPRRAGGVWVSTNKGEIRSYQGHGLAEVAGLGATLPRNLIGKDLLEDRTGVLWIGTAKGLHRFQNGALALVSLPGPMATPATRELHEAADGSLWVGTQQGLFRLKDGGWTRFGEESGLTNSYILSIQSDPAGRVLVGTNGGGLCLLEGGRFRAFHAAQGLPSEVVFRGHRTADGAWWFGSTGGLFRLQGETIKGFKKVDEKLAQTIYQVLEDAEGGLWLTSSRSVARLNPRQAVAVLGGREAQLVLDSFDQRDGLPIGGPTSVGQSLFWNKQLLIATMGGITRLEPALLRAGGSVPMLEALEVRSGGRVLLPGANIEFLSGSDLEIRYAGHTAIAPDRVAFRYTLEGFETRWQAAGDRRAAFYTRVPPGPYRFRVQASQGDGVWQEGAPLAFRITPRWHERRLVRLGGLALLAGAVYALWIWRNRALEARSARLEALVSERTSELTTAKVALETANSELEARVEERTHDLQDALQKALAADDAKTMFLARMSHEFRTPLNHILLYAELVKEEWPSTTPLPADDFRHIQESGKALEVLLADLLDFAEMEAGRLTLRSAPFDPYELLNALEQTFRPKAEAKGLRFELELGDMPKILLGDSHRLGQILRDLTSNAVKFTDAGLVRIQAELLRDSGRLSMAVQDTGPGIPQGYRSRLFSPFEQADGSLVRRHGGTGLGLSLVHGLVSLMGGTLRLVDPQEGGTRFEVELPIAVE